jgi:hypothetical protein
MTQRQHDLRASYADREQVLERLRRAAEEGRLRIDELEDRLSHALNARTHGQLDAILIDLAATKRTLIKHPTRTPVRLPAAPTPKGTPVGSASCCGPPGGR